MKNAGNRGVVFSYIIRYVKRNSVASLTCTDRKLCSHNTPSAFNSILSKQFKSRITLNFPYFCWVIVIADLTDVSIHHMMHYTFIWKIKMGEFMFYKTISKNLDTVFIIYNYICWVVRCIVMWKINWFWMYRIFLNLHLSL